jgi:hypothetical protein
MLTLPQTLTRSSAFKGMCPNLGTYLPASAVGHIYTYILLPLRGAALKKLLYGVVPVCGVRYAHIDALSALSGYPMCVSVHLIIPYIWAGQIQVFFLPQFSLPTRELKQF